MPMVGVMVAWQMRDAKAGGGQKLIEFWHEDGADQDEQKSASKFHWKKPWWYCIRNTLEAVADFQAKHSLNFRGVEQQNSIWKCSLETMELET